MTKFWDRDCAPIAIMASSEGELRPRKTSNSPTKPKGRRAMTRDYDERDFAPGDEHVEEREEQEIGRAYV